MIVIGVVLHLGGVYKHAAFDQDGTFGKMLVAASPGDEASANERAAATPLTDSTSQ